MLIQTNPAEPLEAGTGFWVHFDAKYRIDKPDFVPLLAQDAEEPRRVAKTADIVRMHAYRDAIRSTAAAYAIYPGTEKETFSLTTETLPGVGAIPLRPSAVREDAVGPLARFIDDVLAQVATQGSVLERGRYWSRLVAEAGSIRVPGGKYIPDLKKPLLDTVALLIPPGDGYLDRDGFAVSLSALEAGGLVLGDLAADVIVVFENEHGGRILRRTSDAELIWAAMDADNGQVEAAFWIQTVPLLPELSEKLLMESSEAPGSPLVTSLGQWLAGV
jgi:hypothetical protein